MNSPSGTGFKLDVTVEFSAVPAEIDIVEWNQHLFTEGWQNSHSLYYCCYHYIFYIIFLHQCFFP